jgi:predicted DNA-binding transcriptional regulator YafY
MTEPGQRTAGSGPSERMLELLSLLQTGRAWPGPELTDRLDTSPRTLRRDVDRLRALGYPVESAPGPGGSYRLVAGRAMPPLLFTDDEAVATVVGLRFAAVAVLDATPVDGALRKLEQVLPPRLRERAHAVSESLDTSARVSRADLGLLDALGTAAHRHRDVRFEYLNRAGVSSRRRVEPYRQVLLGRRWYLLGWDLDRRDWRTFRLDRIGELTVPGSTFAPRPLPPDGAASFVQASTRAPVGEHYGVARFAAPVAVVSERLRAEAGTLEALDEHSCRYVTAVDSWEWLSLVLAAVGVPYVVESPPELVEHTRALAARIAASTGA